jgi:hypothetical protein
MQPTYYGLVCVRTEKDGRLAKLRTICPWCGDNCPRWGADTCPLRPRQLLRNNTEEQ